MTEKNQNISPENQQRRRFIKKIWIGLGILAGIETIYLMGSFLFPNRKAKKSPSKDLFIAGNVRNFKLNTITPFRNHKFFLTRTKDGGFIALSIKCTHLGCNIIWEEKSDSFICPCHSSWFNKMGDVMQPPATRPLSVHPVIIDKEIVKVNTQVVIKRNSIEDTKIVYSNKKGKRS